MKKNTSNCLNLIFFHKTPKTFENLDTCIVNKKCWL